MSPLLEPKKKPAVKPVAYRGPADLIADIDEAAKQSGVSRNEAMTQLLRIGLDAVRKDSKKKR